MEEEWKSYIKIVKGFNHKKEHIRTDIEISNFGNVKGTKWNEQNFVPRMIRLKGGRKFIVTTPIYKLVWEAFNGPVPKGYCVHHKDHNKLNDRLDNLELMTKSEHMRHHFSGIKFDEDRRKRMSKQRIGRNLPEETKKKISNSLMGHEVKESTKEKFRGNTNTKNRKWYNNGIISKMFYPEETIPIGFIPGRIKWKDN
jgi:hypothetical protein